MLRMKCAPPHRVRLRRMVRNPFSVERAYEKDSASCHNEHVGEVKNPGTDRPEPNIYEIYNITIIGPPIDNIADTSRKIERDGENTGRVKVLRKQRIGKQTKQYCNSTDAKYRMPPKLRHRRPKT